MEGAEEGATFLTEPKFNYDDLVDDDQGNLEILISGATETSQSTLLLKKKKDMREVDDALEFMKEEYRKRMALCEQRQKKFEEKQLEMKNMVARFHQFIQDNDAKRSRAEQKARMEAQTWARLDKDAKAQRQRLDQLQHDKADLEKRLGALDRYRRYLDAIVSSSEGEYDEIQHLLMRYQTLETAHSDLHAQSKDNTRRIEASRLDLATLKREKQNEALMMGSELQQCLKRVEELTQDTEGLDVASEQADKLVRSKQSDTGLIVNAIQNLYHRCRASMRSQPKVLVNKGKTAAESLDFLSSCLELVGLRMQNLLDIESGYPSWVEKQARAAAKAKAARDGFGGPGRSDGAGAGSGGGGGGGGGGGAGSGGGGGITASHAGSASLSMSVSTRVED